MSPIDTSFLNPETQRYLVTLPTVTDYSLVTVEQVREPSVCPYPLPKLDVTIEKQKISTFTDGHVVNVDVYRPKNVSTDAVLPVLVYLPGGGWTMQATDGHFHLAGKLALEANCAVVLVDYSLSPEVKFPVPLEECYSVIQYVTNPETASSLNVDPTRVALGGDSAGGNLTAAVTIFAKQRNELKNDIKYQVLYYPATGDSFETESFRKFADGYFLTKELTKFFYNNYMNEQAKGNILFSPNLATTEELRGLPPALLVTCEADVLRDDGETYGRLLRKADVPVTSIRVNGVIHSFMANSWILSEETYVTIDMTATALRKAFSKK